MIDRFAVYLLLAGCLGFGAIIFVEFDSSSPRGAASIDSAAARAPKAAATQQQNGLPIDQLVTTALARPLFSATRRPSHAASNSVTDPALTDMRLAGILTAPDRRLAVFAMTGAKPLALTEGDTVSGWHIDSIAPRQVSLSGPGRTKTLQPEADQAGAPQGVPATGPPALTFSRVLPDQQTRDEE